jgi:hypothetical protein
MNKQRRNSPLFEIKKNFSLGKLGFGLPAMSRPSCDSVNAGGVPP